MANQSRPASDVIDLNALQSEPYNFGFYQTLRRFECLHSDKPRIGASVRPGDDALRLAQEPSVIFAPSTLASFKIAGEDHPPTLAVHFFGLFGPNGPLPLHLTEYARDRIRNKDDPTFSEFLDIFHHRMLSLFYRAWASAQPTVNFDRPDQGRFSVYTGALFGLGMPAFRNRDEIPDAAKLYFAGRLSPQARNVEGLVAMIKRFFHIPIAIEEFVGEWMRLPHSARCRLGITTETCTLGVNAILGDYVWQCQHKFRIVLGPLSYQEYEQLLPGKESGKRLRALVRNYIGDSIDWDVKLVLKTDEVTGVTLGLDDLLGWNTWLGHRTRDDDADDLILEPMQAMV